MSILLDNVINKIKDKDMAILYHQDGIFVLQCNKHKYHIYKTSSNTIRRQQWNGCKFCSGGITHIVDKIFKVKKYCENNGFEFIKILSAKTANPSFLIKNKDKVEYILRYHDIKNRDVPFCKKEVYSKCYLSELALSNNLKIININGIDLKNIKVSTKFKCKCLRCGKIYDKTITYLKEGHGCYYCKRNSLTREEEYNEILKICSNNNYQLLTSLSDFTKRETKLKFLCKLHNEIFYQKAYLMIRRGFGCPFCKMTLGEKCISDYLKLINIPFKTQKKFKTLKGLGGGDLRYDFYIPSKNLLIEYQGEQHYNKFRWEEDDVKLTRRKEHDRLKREYAKQNQIRLLEIRYDEDIIKKLQEVLE